MSGTRPGRKASSIWIIHLHLVLCALVGCFRSACAGMTARPTVRRTYGKPSRQPPSSSLVFASSPVPGASSTPLRSSSPAPSSLLATPPPSSPPRVVDDDDDDPPSSPLFPSRSPSPTLGDGISLESVLEVKPEIKVKRSNATAQSTLRGFFAQLPRSKRPLHPAATFASYPSSSCHPLVPAIPLGVPTAAPPVRPLKAALTQTHLTHLPLLHTCRECSMSFVRGGEDESHHARHHARVVRGIPWEGLGKGRIKGKGKEGDGGWRVGLDDVEFGEGRGIRRGKVVICDGSWGGHKLDEILSTVDTVLSSPPLPPAILNTCKIFLFLTSSPPPSRKRPRPLPGTVKPRERIVSIVVAQPIKVAMRVIRCSDVQPGQTVDSGGGVVCDPEPLPTPLGIHRLFTIPSYRALSLAHVLLDAACRWTVYGCTFSPTKGEVAFSQPTDSGRKVMERWGGGAVRVFVDDERQL